MSYVSAVSSHSWAQKETTLCKKKMCNFIVNNVSSLSNVTAQITCKVCKVLYHVSVFAVMKTCSEQCIIHSLKMYFVVLLDVGRVLQPSHRQNFMFCCSFWNFIATTAVACRVSLTELLKALCHFSSAFQTRISKLGEAIPVLQFYPTKSSW